MGARARRWRHTRKGKGEKAVARASVAGSDLWMLPGLMPAGTLQPPPPGTLVQRAGSERCPSPHSKEGGPVSLRLTSRISPSLFGVENQQDRFPPVRKG